MSNHRQSHHDGFILSLVRVCVRVCVFECVCVCVCVWRGVS